MLDRLYRGYGEGAPSGNGPDQGRIQAEGNSYLKAQFPQLDAIVSAKLVAPDSAAASPAAPAPTPAPAPARRAASAAPAAPRRDSRSSDAELLP